MGRVPAPGAGTAEADALDELLLLLDALGERAAGTANRPLLLLLLLLLLPTCELLAPAANSGEGAMPTIALAAAAGSTGFAFGARDACSAPEPSAMGNWNGEA